MRLSWASVFGLINMLIGVLALYNAAGVVKEIDLFLNPNQAITDLVQQLQSDFVNHMRSSVDEFND